MFYQTVIHFNQSAYVKSRTIFDAVRTIEDIREFSKRYSIDGRMVSIHFKKALTQLVGTIYFELDPFSVLDHLLLYSSTLFTRMSRIALK